MTDSYQEAVKEQYEYDDDEYPHWRRALFGDPEDGYLVNAWCAVKYVLWHSFHALFVLFAGIILAILVPAMLGYRALTYALLVSVRWLDRQFVRTVGRWQLGERARTRTQRVAHTTRETPVTRRVYGYCPVHIKMSPRWFSRLSAAGQDVFDWAKPPEYHWVCDVCGQTREYDPGRFADTPEQVEQERVHTIGDCGGTYRREEKVSDYENNDD